MSDVQNTAAAAELPTTESTTAPEVSQPEVIPAVAPPAESKPDEITADHQLQGEVATAEQKATDITAIPETPAEPITEGVLTYKGPGLLKSLIPSKKDFWLTDDATTPAQLSSYMRGEKADISHPVVAWASQTGKGLLFFNKKGDTNRKNPASVLPLYDATELRKRNPQEISFSIAGHEHVLKAATDAERDGWFSSIEKSAEMAKASRTEIVESEGYKEELEKLQKPHVAATAAAVVSKRGQSAAKNDETERRKSDAEEQTKKDKKARSTSRGVLDRFKGKKEEPEPKKDEKEADKEIAKPEEEHKTEEEAVAGAAVVGAGTAGVAAIEEDKKDSIESPAEASKAEEKPKPIKRNSIFGKMAGWGGMKSPSKEKDAELKPEVPAKDGVSEEPPVLPETATTERTDPEVEADKIESKAEKEVEQEHAAEEAKKEEPTPTSPAKEKTGFLAGFLPKRNRSVSPSPALTKGDAEVEKEVAEGSAPADEAVGETSAIEPLEKTETPNKRQSMLGSLGRRASKAMSGMRAPKKENVAPSNEAAKETTDAPAEAEKPVIEGEDKAAEPEPATIGDVVPSAISVGTEQAPTVAASA